MEQNIVDTKQKDEIQQETGKNEEKSKKEISMPSPKHE